MTREPRLCAALLRSLLQGRGESVSMRGLETHRLGTVPPVAMALPLMRNG